MTLFYPDVSSAQAGMSLSGAVAVCAKVTESDGYLNPAYADFRQQAEDERALFFAYHFLHPGNLDGQAAWCRRWAGDVPVMIDCEPVPDAGSFPRLADLLGFADAYRKAGGTVHLAYLPRWYWISAVSSGGLGMPSLTVLGDQAIGLISSDYLPYSDGGPGWQEYGGAQPVIWQYTDTADMNGRLVDRNAFKGTTGQLAQLIATGSTAAPKPPPRRQGPEEDPMQLESGSGAETIISLSCGSASWIEFACDASRTHSPQPVLRVAAHSQTKGMSQVVELTMPANGAKNGVAFTAKDVDYLSVVRNGGNAGDQVAVGYNYG